MAKLMKSVSGIRGIVGESLTVEKVLKFAKRFGNYVENGKVLVGRDSRVSGKMIFNAVSAGLMSVGCEVVDLGICPTPTILLEVEHTDAVGGIAITASHNPKEWNALKLVTSEGNFLNENQSERFWQIDYDNIEEENWDKIGKLTEDSGAIDNHIGKILNLENVKTKEIKSNKFKVVIDSTNGAGGVLSPELLRRMGCEVVELFSETSGVFSRIPEPIAKNLTELEKKVKGVDADVGFATDPDVDRLSVVSNQGTALGTEYTLGLVEEYILSSKKGNIATNLSSSMISDRIAEKYDVKVFRAKVGEINVVDQMKKHDCVVGGEGNGGIIYPDLHFTRDAPMAMALILSYLAVTDKTCDELATEIPKFYMEKSKFAIDDNFNFNKFAEKVKSNYSKQNFDYTDGLKIIGNDFWIHVRKSGTEPIVRVIAESDSRKRSIEFINNIKKLK